MQTTYQPYEILIRLTTAAGVASIQGAIQRRTMTITDDTGKVLMVKECDPEPISAADLPSILNPALATFSGTLSSLQSQLDAAIRSADEEKARADAATLEADNQQARADALQSQVTTMEGRISDLTAQLISSPASIPADAQPQA